MKYIESLKIVQEFLYQRNHCKMKRQIRKHRRTLEHQWSMKQIDAN